MKDIFGRDAMTAMPDWMKLESTGGRHGCGKEDCQFGIVWQPQVVVALPIYITEAILHGKFDMVRYCDCRWGQLAKARAALTWKRIETGVEYVPQTNVNAIEMQVFGDEDEAEVEGPTIRYVEVA